MQVLVVCAANQCRSRVAEALLQHTLGDLPDVYIASAGTHVEASMPMCHEAAEFVTRTGVRVDTGRRGVPASPELLQQADLILTADAQVRAAVVALDPGTRTRLFALRSAGLAADHLLTQGLVPLARAAHAAGLPRATDEVDGEAVVRVTALGPTDGVRWIQEELAAALGFTHAVDGTDIDDAHQGHRSQHARTLTDVQRATQPLAALLRTVLKAE